MWLQGCSRAGSCGPSLGRHSGCPEAPLLLSTISSTSLSSGLSSGSLSEPPLLRGLPIHHRRPLPAIGERAGREPATLTMARVCFQGRRVSAGEGNGNPLQYSCLENSMDGGAWRATVHGAPRSWTQLSNFTLFFHFHALEKEMATHSSVLAWRIPGTGEPGGLPSMGSHRVGHN